MSRSIEELAVMIRDRLIKSQSMSYTDEFGKVLKGDHWCIHRSCEGGEMIEKHSVKIMIGGHTLGPITVARNGGVWNYGPVQGPCSDLILRILINKAASPLSSSVVWGPLIPALLFVPLNVN